jgi:hypothetical protein
MENAEVFKNIKISSQENILLGSLQKFYLNNEKAKDIIPIIEGHSKISMRLIDFFVTNYSKKNLVNYEIEMNDRKMNFNVYLSYKSQLKAFNKRYFDPFSRGNRIPFFFDDYCIITTIGQLNFFKWYLSNNVNDYILKNYSNIDKELAKSKKLPKINNIPKIKKEFKLPKTMNLIQLNPPSNISFVSFD